jgi:mono/diheme cytochrome c family protein
MTGSSTRLLKFFIAMAFMAPAGAWAQGNHCVAQKSPRKMAVEAGQLVYTSKCVTCHQPDGSGSSGLNPPLIKTSGIQGGKQELIELVIRGSSRHTGMDGQKYQNIMPPNPEMTDDDIANVLTYIRKNFGNKASVVKVSEVKAARERLK